MDGGVAVPNMPPPGFFHMPRMQVPNYQRPRFHVPYNNVREQHPNAQQGPSSSGADSNKTTTPAASTSNTIQMSGSDLANIQFDGKRMRKAVVRKTVDYNTSIVKYLENRTWQRDERDFRAVQPDSLYQLDMVPPSYYRHKPMNCLTTKFMRQSTNKFRCPIFCLAWTPEGRRLVTGASSGEFTLWNGLTFSFETILQAHETSVRAMQWSHNDQWMVTGDHAGFIKYWQSNMNNVKMYQGHKEAIRGISLCPTDSKFASCSDDGTVRVWDFMRCYEEKILRGHGADVKCVDWHPQKSLIASGSKDNQVPIKLWDPKSGSSLATLHAHKFTVMDLSWNKNGNWLLTAARDHLIKLFDIRNLKEELQIFKGHKKEATAVAWHPINEQMFASGGSDGAIMFWNAGTDKEVGAMEEAHDAIIWDLAWHPLGHVLVSGSNDHSTKFWTRNRPGDAMRDKYNLNIVVTGPDGEALDIDHDMPLGEGKSLLPGMGLEHGLPPVEEEEEKIDPNAEGADELPAIPGLDWSADAVFFKEQQKGEEKPRKKTPYARPIPRSFEQAWITNQQPGTLVKDDKDGSVKRGKIQSLLTLELPDRPPPGLEYVDYDQDDSEVMRQPADINSVTAFNPVPPILPMARIMAQGPGDMMPNPGMMQIPGFGSDMDQRPNMPPSGDQDYRSDQDYRQDQDHRTDSDYRPGDTDFRANMGGSGPFGGDRPPPMMAGPGGQFQGGALDRSGGPMGGQMGHFGNDMGGMSDRSMNDPGSVNDRNMNDRGGMNNRGGMNDRGGGMNDSYEMDNSFNDSYEEFGSADNYRGGQGYDHEDGFGDRNSNPRQGIQGDWDMESEQENSFQGRNRKPSDRNRGRGGDQGAFRGRGSRGNRGFQQQNSGRGGGRWNNNDHQNDRDFEGNDDDMRGGGGGGGGGYKDSGSRGGGGVISEEGGEAMIEGGEVATEGVGEDEGAEEEGEVIIVAEEGVEEGGVGTEYEYI